jgi:hypothetical protein
MKPERHNLFVLFMLTTMTPDREELQKGARRQEGTSKGMSFDYSSILSHKYCIS